MWERVSRGAWSTFAVVALTFGCGGTAKPAAEDAGADGGASKAASVGAAGGSVVVEGLTLTVPAGALKSDTNLTVRSTSEAGPSGATRYSPVYLFEPAGLTFQAAAAIEMAFTGDAARAAVFWSSSDGATWEKLATTASGGRAKASVTHFSRAFVGDGTVSFPSLGGGACGAAFTGACFGCYQKSCGTQFARCFGSDAASGTFTGACAKYGECICKCTSDEDCKKCQLDATCNGCNQESGLFTCASDACATACGG